jgi:hypothetical protein
MLYDVPQTDSATETAMVSVIARLRRTSAKPEALAGVEDDTIALHLAQQIGVVLSALADRLPLGSVVVRWDAALDGVAIALATVTIYNSRGRNRDAGADEGIDKSGERADAYLSRLRSPHREEQPIFELSPGGPPADAPALVSADSAQAWTRPRGAQYQRRGVGGS